MAQRHHARCALAHVGWFGLHHDLHRWLCRLCQRRDRSPERRVRGQHTKIALPMGVRRWHQRGNAGCQLQRCEVQLVEPGTALVRARLAMLFCAAVVQGGALFAKAHTKARAVARPMPCPEAVMKAVTPASRWLMKRLSKNTNNCQLLNSAPPDEGHLCRHHSHEKHVCC